MGRSLEDLPSRGSVVRKGLGMQRATEAGGYPRRVCRLIWAAVAAAVCTVGLLLAPMSPRAQDVTFFRIGTGSTSGTYFPIGGLLANAISKPPGSRDCDQGGSCGVPGLIAVAQSTEGSVSNIRGIADGSLESGLAQADIAYWAYRGEGIFKKTGPVTSLRSIASLFPESVHLVVGRDKGIRSVADLRGHRISLDREGSGTRVDALLILKAFGLSLGDIDAQALSADDAADALRAGEIDGFFMVVGTPANAVVSLADDSLITLIPIGGPEVDALKERYPFFSRDHIASGTYFNVPDTETLAVGAQWLVSETVPEDLVYEITRALWHKNTRQLLDNGHPRGRQITLQTALDGLVVPLHPGARRYYGELSTPFLGKAGAEGPVD